MMLNQRTIFVILEYKYVRQSLSTYPDEEGEDSDAGVEEEVLCAIGVSVEGKLTRGADCINTGLGFAM